jgi:hypothetical protein
MIKQLSPVRVNSYGIIEKFCGGKNGCKKYLPRWQHFSPSDSKKLNNGSLEYRATCDLCCKKSSKDREAKRYKRPKLEVLPEKRVFKDAYAMPWKPTGKPIMTGMFGCWL